MFNVFNSKPQIISKIPASKLSWKRDAILVWMPSSEGNLRYVYGYDKQNEPKEFLLLNDVPLIKIHSNECPTCDQLLQAGYGIDKVDRKIIDGIVNYENLCELNESSVLECLNPILTLLESGLYLISNIQYYPTDGQGNCFWTISNKPRLFKGLAQSWEAQEIPSFLIPTQPQKNIDYGRVEHYRSKLRTGEQLGGMAFYIEGYMSAILDGHHRALASLLECKPINCVTISRVHAVSIEHKTQELKAFWACGETIDASILQNSIKKKIKDMFTNIKKIDTLDVNKYLNMQADGWNNMHFDKEVTEAARSFPTINDIVSIYLAGELTDEIIVDRFQGNGFNEDNKEELKHTLNALIALNDTRAYQLSFKIALSDRWISLWEEAYRYLARFRNNEIENLFIDFLINDEENRTHIKKIIDDYFRQ